LTAAILTDTPPNGVGGQVKWTYSVTQAAIVGLAAGDTKVETFTVVVADGHGGTDSETVTVTITGSNDSPVAAPAGTASNATQSGSEVTGQLAASDLDLGDVLSYGPSGTPVAGLTINTDGSWSFDPSNSAYTHLPVGVVEEITAGYVATDLSGATVTGTFVINITGVNDAAAITSPTADFDLRCGGHQARRQWQRLGQRS
jgi:VCBS repeat-containing protein